MNWFGHFWPSVETNVFCYKAWLDDTARMNKIDNRASNYRLRDCASMVLTPRDS